MAHPPPYEYDTSPTRISTNQTNLISSNDTRITSTITICSDGTSYVTTSYYQSYEIPKREIVETKKEKLDRVSKEKMLASHKIYNQKDMNIIKIKQMCKPKHRISNGAFRGLR